MKAGRILSGIAAAAMCGSGLTPVAAQQAVPGPAPTAAPVKPCAAQLKTFKLPGHTLEIDSAVQVAPAAPGTVRANPYAPPIPSAMPGYCKVSGVIDPRSGVGGKRYGLRFELNLPANWNGRFLMQGGGGLNGSVNPALGATASGDTPALGKGFAVISTDGGHQGAVFDGAFMADQRATLDFALSAVPTVASAGKAMTEAFYGRKIAHSYMAGCSTGGREGMMMSQRYPEMFDGIVIGAPAMRTGWSNLALAHAAVAFNQAAPLAADGKPDIAKIFSDADRATIHKGLLAQCDAKDGLADGWIGNPGACHFDPAKLVCAAGQTEGCLSAKQASALSAAFSAPKDSGGRALYSAFPFDTGITSKGPGLPGFLPTGGPGIFGPANRDLSIDLDAMAAGVRERPDQVLTDTATWTNLSTFLGHGGKVLFFHGVSDPWFSAWDTLDYWNRAAAANGAAWGDASRFYMVPGMSHCAGGADTYDSFDLLTPLVNWVEQGKAAGAVTASRAMPSPGSRPLCPWPQHAEYKGGDATKAESFVCEGPSETQ